MEVRETEIEVVLSFSFLGLFDYVAQDSPDLRSSFCLSSLAQSFLPPPIATFSLETNAIAVKNDRGTGKD